MSCIGLIGGTGKEGRGLALRWARAGYQIAIGSRDAARGVACADQLAGELATASRDGICGGDNVLAAQKGDVVVLCVPYSAHRATLTPLCDALAGKILVDITVPLMPPKVTQVHLPPGRAAALEAQELLGEKVQVVAALHHISSAHLSDVEHPIDCDILVCSNHGDARAAVIELLHALGSRALDAGPLCNAIALEAFTPVLLHLNRRYKGKGCGLRITGIPEL